METLRIELLSDLCSSSGENYGAQIDNDVCYDEHGFPYIPARRLKGCLRDIAVQLTEWGIIHNEIVSEIFGSPGKGKGRLVLYDAVPDNYRKLKNEVESSKHKVYLHPQNVLENYTYIRAQTALENGVAKKDSLRYTRVVKKGMIFTCGFSIENSTEDIFEAFVKCCKGLRYMGMNRNRGLGHVRITVDKDQADTFSTKNNPFDKEKLLRNIKEEHGTEYALEYGIFLLSPMMFPKTGGNGDKTETFIPGSNVLGYFVSRYFGSNNGQSKFVDIKEFKEMFVEGELVFENAYISDGKSRYLPVSAAYQKEKDKDMKYLYDTTFAGEKKEKMRLKSVGDKYTHIYSSEDKTQGKILETHTQVEYHHKQASVSYNEREFYQYESISRGQTFFGIIRGKAEKMRKIIEMLPDDGVISLGRSKNAQYGKGEIVRTEIKEIIREEKRADKFVVQLVSPAIVLNEAGVASTDLEVLTKEIQEFIKGASIEVVKPTLRYKTVGGYNVKWNLPKQQILAFDKGTTIVYKGKNGEHVDISGLNNTNIGERTAEGYGEISAYEFSNCSKIEIVNKRSDEQPKSDNRIGPVLKPVLKRIAINELQQLAMKNTKSEKLNSTTVGKLTEMMDESKNFNEFLERINSIKDIEKKEGVLKTLFGKEKKNEENMKKHIWEKRKETGVYKYLIENSADEDIEILDHETVYKEYIDALLNRAKYLIRQKKVEENEEV